MVMMARRGKGGLKQNLEDKGSNNKNKPPSAKSLNRGKGQEITGVTLPANGRYRNSASLGIVGALFDLVADL